MKNRDFAEGGPELLPLSFHWNDDRLCQSTISIASIELLCPFRTYDIMAELRSFNQQYEKSHIIKTLYIYIYIYVYIPKTVSEVIAFVLFLNKL